MVKRITPQQLSTVLFNWSEFPKFESLKNEPILCVELNGELLTVESVTLEEGRSGGKQVHRMTLNTSRPPRSLHSFMGEAPASDDYVSVRSETRQFHHK